MSFRFNEDQWSKLQDLIVGMGSEATSYTRASLENRIAMGVVSRKFDEDLEEVLIDIYEAADVLAQNLEKLAAILQKKAELDSLGSQPADESEIEAPKQFAEEVRGWRDAAELEYDAFFGSSGSESVRGRPVDEATQGFASVVVEFAYAMRWPITDDRGNTTPDFMDFVAEVASCVRSVGPRYCTENRRALSRAIKLARREHEQSRKSGAEALDSLLRGEHEKPPANSNYLPRAPRKSD